MCRKSGCDYEDCQNGHGNMEALIRHRQFRNSSTSKGIRSRMTVHRFIDFTSNIANISKTTVSLSLSLSWILIAIWSTESSGKLRNAHCIQNARIYRSGGLHVAVHTDHEVSQGLGINPRHKKAFLLLWVLPNHGNSIDTTQWQVTINESMSQSPNTSKHELWPACPNMKAHFDPHIHSWGRQSTATESKRISLCVPSQREPEEKRRSVGAVEANKRGLRFNQKDYVYNL